MIDLIDREQTIDLIDREQTIDPIDHEQTIDPIDHEQTINLIDREQIIDQIRNTVLCIMVRWKSKGCTMEDLRCTKIPPLQRSSAKTVLCKLLQNQ